MNNNEILSDVFTNIMENTVFMFGDKEDKSNLSKSDGEIIKAEIGFVGPSKGKLILIAPKSSCKEMAVNLLGVMDEDELTPDQPIDAVKEVINITMGNILTEIAGTEPIFDLTIPEVTELNNEEWQVLFDDDTMIGFDFDDETLLLGLYFN